MKADELRVALAQVVNDWSRRPFSELAEMQFPIAYSIGKRGTPGSFQVEITLLEQSENEIHLAITIDDGGLRSFLPVADSVVVKRSS